MKERSILIFIEPLLKVVNHHSGEDFPQFPPITEFLFQIGRFLPSVSSYYVISTSFIGLITITLLLLKLLPYVDLSLPDCELLQTL